MSSQVPSTRFQGSKPPSSASIPTTADARRTTRRLAPLREGRDHGNDRLDAGRCQSLMPLARREKNSALLEALCAERGDPKIAVRLFDHVRDHPARTEIEPELDRHEDDRKQYADERDRQTDCDRGIGYGTRGSESSQERFSNSISASWRKISKPSQVCPDHRARLLTFPGLRTKFFCDTCSGSLNTIGRLFCTTNATVG